MLEDPEKHDLQIRFCSGTFVTKEPEAALVEVFGPVRPDVEEARHLGQVTRSVVRQNLSKTFPAMKMLPSEVFLVNKS